MNTFHIDEPTKSVLVAYSGVVTDADLRFGLTEYGRLGPEYTFLIDFREVEDFAFSRRGLQALTEYWRTHQHKRCAIIAATDVAFGIARMIEGYADNSAIHVFRTEGTAREWLGLH